MNHIEYYKNHWPSNGSKIDSFGQLDRLGLPRPRMEGSGSVALARFSDPKHLGQDWRTLTRDLRPPRWAGVPRFRGLPLRHGPAGFKEAWQQKVELDFVKCQLSSIFCMFSRDQNCMLSFVRMLCAVFASSLPCSVLSHATLTGQDCTKWYLMF